MISTAATAQGRVCGERGDILGQLGARYKEVVIERGISNSGAMIELVTTEDGSTWTILATTPNGITCLIEAGEDWTAVARPAVGDPS